MRLRKFLDQRFAEGVRDAERGLRRNPARWGEPGTRVEPYARWAYDAGYRAGEATFRRVVAAARASAGEAS